MQVVFCFQFGYLCAYCFFYNTIEFVTILKPRREVQCSIPAGLYCRVWLFSGGSSPVRPGSGWLLRLSISACPGPLRSTPWLQGVGQILWAQGAASPLIKTRKGGGFGVQTAYITKYQTYYYCVNIIKGILLKVNIIANQCS